MPNTRIRPRPPRPSLAERAINFAREAMPHNTYRAYKAAWEDFADWCQNQRRPSLPASADTLILYVTHLADGQSVASIHVKLAAIARVHRAAKQPDPTVDDGLREVLKGIRRKLKTAPHKKTAVTLDELRPMLNATTGDLRGLRDRALILIGYAGAFRRSELIALDVSDCHFQRGRVVITLRQSKTDQDGEGSVKVIPAVSDKSICPVATLRAWLSQSGISSGPLFRAIDRWGNVRADRLNDHAVAFLVKKLATAAGMDARDFAGHSLRRGMITQAAINGALPLNIMQQSKHKSVTVLQGYIDDGGHGASEAVLAAFGEKGGNR